MWVRRPDHTPVHQQLTLLAMPARRMRESPSARCEQLLSQSSGRHAAFIPALGALSKQLPGSQAKELISAGLLLEEDDVVPAHLLPAWSAQAWDCESVLSRHSTLDNHPGLLAEPRHARRQHRAAHSRLVAHQEGLEADGAEAARGADGDAATVGAGTEGLSQGSRAGESCEEKRERKAEVKAQRRVAREVKKASSKMYKAGSLAARTASHADGGVRVFPLSS